jgi:catechol 2,3-dioxygenase-like lactoylglutathione lyase family enzyme
MGAVAVIVPSYEEGLSFFSGTLGFDIVEDTELAPGKRWVLVAPPGSSETRLLLAMAATDEQRRAIGAQAGGRVFLFLHTDDFARDHRRYSAAGVRFLEEPRVEAYGTVAVFADPFGNKWDLIEPVTVHEDQSAV